MYIYTYFALKLDETWILQHVYNFNSLLRHPYINQLTKGIHRWKIINLYPHHPHQSRRSMCVFGLLTKFPDQGSLWKEKIELVDPIKTILTVANWIAVSEPFGFWWNFKSSTSTFSCGIFGVFPTQQKPGKPTPQPGLACRQMEATNGFYMEVFLVTAAGWWLGLMDQQVVFLSFGRWVAADITGRYFGQTIIVGFWFRVGWLGFGFSSVQWVGSILNYIENLTSLF